MIYGLHAHPLYILCRRRLSRDAGGILVMGRRPDLTKVEEIVNRPVWDRTALTAAKRVSPALLYRTYLSAVSRYNVIVDGTYETNLQVVQEVKDVADAVPNSLTPLLT